MSNINSTAEPLPWILCEVPDTGIAGVESASPFCLKVHRALQLAGHPYQRRYQANPAAHGHNPTGQVPVLLVGSQAVCDSTAIMAAIEAQVPGSLLPTDARLRAEAWLWEEFADTALNGFFVASRWADNDNWPQVKLAYFAGMPALVRAVVPGLLRKRVLKGLVARDVTRAGMATCWQRYQHLLDQLDARAPATGFWLGEQPCLADVALFAQLHGLRLPWTQKQHDWIAARPNLTAWLDRVAARIPGPNNAARA